MPVRCGSRAETLPLTSLCWAVQFIQLRAAQGRSVYGYTIALRSHCDSSSAFVVTGRRSSTFTMSATPPILHWDAWEPPVEHPDQERHSKPSKVRRFLARKHKQDAFMALPTDDALAYLEQNEKANQDKNSEARAEKWWRSGGGRWVTWHGEWYWRQWQVKERWNGPY